jgi:hypothetical protein
MWANRQAYNFTSNCFCKRKLATPITETVIGTLQVRRQRIVDKSSYIRVTQHLLKTVPLRRAHYELVPNRASEAQRAGHYYIQAAEQLQIGSRRTTAPLIPSIEIPELHLKHCGLDWIEATVYAALNIYVLLFGAVVSEASDTC